MQMTDYYMHFEAVGIYLFISQASWRRYSLSMCVSFAWSMLFVSVHTSQTNFQARTMCETIWLVFTICFFFWLLFVVVKKIHYRFYVMYFLWHCTLELIVWYYALAKNHDAVYKHCMANAKFKKNSNNNNNNEKIHG